jgi:hypothetical protein
MRGSGNVEQFNEVMYTLPQAIPYSPTEQIVYDAWHRLGNLSAHDLHMAWLMAVVHGPNRAIKELEAESADAECTRS